MRAASFTETRTRVGVKVTPRDHFFFDGTGTEFYADGSADYGFRISGAVRGTVKITVMVSGDISVKSQGPNGNGKRYHLSPTTKVVLDGETYTLDSLVRFIIAEEAFENMLTVLGL